MTFYVFDQDMRKVGARISISSVPEEWYELEGPVPVTLEDPESVGDIAPESGADTIGDIVGGAFSLYSSRLCEALNNFGLKLNYKPAEIFKPGSNEPVKGYNMVLGVNDSDCLAHDYNELEYFEIDSEKAKGLSLFDLQYSLRIIDESLKLHLDNAGLDGVFMVPTKEYGGMFAYSLKWG